MPEKNLNEPNHFLECEPTSVFSKNFKISGSKDVVIELKFNFFGESGSINYNGVRYPIVKAGFWAGRWNLFKDGVGIGSANNTRLIDTYEFHINGMDFSVQAVPFSKRFYDIYLNGEVVGTFRPESRFFRRATLECYSKISELALVFSFWIIASKSYGYRKSI